MSAKMRSCPLGSKVAAAQSDGSDDCPGRKANPAKSHAFKEYSRAKSEKPTTEAFVTLHPKVAGTSWPVFCRLTASPGVLVCF